MPPLNPRLPPLRRRVLLVFLKRFEECDAMLRGIAQYERAHEPWTAFLDDEARAVTDLDWLARDGWRGVICRHTTPPMAARCREIGLPLVDLNDVPSFAHTPKIRPDNRAVGHLGAEEFIERGYRHLAFCGYSGEAWSVERREGFIEAAALAGRAARVFDVPFPQLKTPSWDAAENAQLVDWLRSMPKPIGVLACNDLRGIQVVTAAQASGFLVPEEVAVIGVNNDQVRCELSYPRLSSVATNSAQSGFLAAELLDSLMRGATPPAATVRVEPVGVVTRHSSDVLAIDDRHVATALSFIREHACRGVSVDAVLSRVPMTRSRLEKGFRRFLGRSPQVEIRRVQVAKAKQLLVETDYPLKHISELTGFEHVEYLSVVFKRFTGVAPGQFRKKAQAGERN